MRGQAGLLEVKCLEREDANGTLRAIWTVLDRLREQSCRGTPTETDLLERLRSLAAAARGRPRPGGVGPLLSRDAIAERNEEVARLPLRAGFSGHFLVPYSSRSSCASRARSNPRIDQAFFGKRARSSR